jgi:hypothetical protein
MRHKKNIISLINIDDNGIQTSSESLIHSEHKCSLKNWKIDPINAIHLTNQCYFIALEDDITMTHDFHLSKHRRLIEREEAFFEFYFKASLKHPEYLRADFLFFNDQLRQNLINRSKYSSFIPNDKLFFLGLSTIITEISSKTDHSFSSYIVSSTKLK